MSFDEHTRDDRERWTARGDEQSASPWIEGDEFTGRARVEKLVGAPGSGKTTRLLEIIEEEAANGLALNDLRVYTFTRAGRAEMRSHLEEIYPRAEREEYVNAVRTVHGAALKCCLDAELFQLRTQPADDGLWLLTPLDASDEASVAATQAFFNDYYPQYEYDPAASDPLSESSIGGKLSGEQPVGNQLLAVNDYITSVGLLPEQYWVGRGPEEVDGAADQVVVEMLHQWRAFKERHDLIEHGDYVAMAVEHDLVPDAQVVLIDEFQDLDPMQQQLYESWRDSQYISRIYIAGDANQSIYGFRGVDPSYFPETPADQVVRQQTSYRCPSAIIRKATRVLGDAAPGADAVSVEAHADGGSVHHRNVENDSTLAALVRDRLDGHGDHPDADSVFLLSRTNRQARRVARTLRSAGIPYFGLEPDGRFTVWQDPFGAILEALRCFNDGRNPPLPNAKYLLTNTRPLENEAQDEFRTVLNAGQAAMLAHSFVTEHDPIPTPTLKHAAFRAMFPSPDYRDARDLVPLFEADDWIREMLRAAITGESLHHPMAVRVGTIHKAKGREAAHVMLFPDYGHQQAKRYERDPELVAEEDRVFYVAITRASETVDIVHGFHSQTAEYPLLRR